MPPRTQVAPLFIPGPPTMGGKRTRQRRPPPATSRATGVLVALAAVAISGGCLGNADYSSAVEEKAAAASAWIDLPTSYIPTPAPKPGATAEAAPSYAVHSINRTLHLRIGENGTLLYSSWPGERGLLQDQPNPDAAPPLAITNNSTLPELLGPLYPLWDAAPSDVSMAVEGYRPSDTTDSIRIPRSFVVPREGYLATSAAGVIFEGAQSPGVYSFADTITVEILEWEDDAVRYRFPLENATRYNVSRTNGLFLTVEPDENALRISLDAPDGAFDSTGCRVVPGTLIPPGHFQLVGSEGDEWILKRYADRMEHALRGRTLSVEAHLY